MSEHTVRLVLRQEAVDGYEHALNDLREALGGDANVPDPDDTGVIEATLEAADEDAAVKRAIDAIAAAGADDHFEIAEHPETPGHWRHAEDS